jgi:predicted dehydrogenase
MKVNPGYRMDSKIKIGIIGCGLASTWHIDAALSVEQAEICALADINPENLEQTRKRISESRGANVRLFADYRESIDTAKPDAVFILTPHSLHYEQVKYALERNINVLCEKPLVLSVNEAEELSEIARRKDRILYVSYQFNLYGVVRYTYEMIQKGRLGDIRYFNGILSINWKEIVSGWRKHHAVSGGGMMMDSGSHLLALFVHLLKPSWEHVRVISDAAGDSVDIVTNVLVTFNGNRTGVLSAVGLGPFMFDVSVTGDRGAIFLRDLNDVLHIDEEDFRRELGTYASVNRWNAHEDAEEYKTLNPTVEFLKAIGTGNSSFGNADLGIEVARLSTAIDDSITADKTNRKE